MLYTLFVGICSLQMAGVFNVEVKRVGKHGIDFLLQFLRSVGKVDTVAERL